MPINCLDDIKHAFYINLEHRTDRKIHVEEQLKNIGIHATRFNAIKMENGAIGCCMSHLKLLEMAKLNKLDHILILEDDIMFLDPILFKNQFNKFMEIHGNNWDVILLAGNNMPPYENIDETCIKVSRCQTTTGYLVNGHFINPLLTQFVSLYIGIPEKHLSPVIPLIYIGFFTYNFLFIADFKNKNSKFETIWKTIILTSIPLSLITGSYALLIATQKLNLPLWLKISA
jgi:hypothetical protein